MQTTPDRNMKKIILRNKSDWAIICVDDSHGVLVMIHSSYGSWAFNWSSIGDDYIKFLETSDVHYTFNKFSNSLRLSASQKIQKREKIDYEFFYNTFWKMLIEKLKE